MSPVVVGLIGLALMIVLVLLGVHVAFALIVLGFAGLVILMDLEPALSSIAIISFDKTTDYQFAVVPLFLLMGAFVSRSLIGAEAYEMARIWVGQLRGGLAMATSVASGLFAAACGSSLASAVAMGKIAYPEMKRHNYDDKLSVGCIAAGGTLGILIPPSMGFILIGILTQLSVGKLFIAGIIPGILEVIFYMGTIYILCKFNLQLGPPSARANIRQKFGALKLSWPVLVLFLLVIGGIYGGVFTPTEAGGIGAFGALVISLVRKQLSRLGLAECLLDTAMMSAMLIALIIGAFIFNQFLAVTRITFIASEYIAELGMNKYIILAIILVLYIILGTILDIYGIIVITVPILFPVMSALGFDPIWYAVIMVRIIEIGLVTPPFGINLFGLAGVVDVPVGALYRGVMPFLVADFFHVALLIAVPSLSTFLPDMMLGR